jgi:hypothetical protein
MQKSGETMKPSPIISTSMWLVSSSSTSRSGELHTQAFCMHEGVYNH